MRIVDAPGNAAWQLEGRNDCVMTTDPERIQCSVDRSSLRFVYWFWPPFLVLAITLICMLAKSTDERILFVTLFVVIGVAMYMFLVGIMTAHIDRGDYLRIDLVDRSVQLPRHGTHLSIDDILFLENREHTGNDGQQRWNLHLVTRWPHRRDTEGSRNTREHPETRDTRQVGVSGRGDESAASESEGDARRYHLFGAATADQIRQLADALQSDVRVVTESSAA